MSLPPSEIPQGAIRFNTDSQKLEFYAQGEWWVMSTDTPNLGRGADTTAGARGVYMGGWTGSITDAIDFFNLSSPGDAQDFGNLTTTRRQASGCSSSTRGLSMGGQDSTTKVNKIDMIEFASTGSAADFGDLAVTTHYSSALSNATRGINAGGYVPAAPTLSNQMNYVTIASNGVNGQDFGNLVGTFTAMGVAASPVRGVFGGGYSPSSPNDTIQHITIATLGDAQDFGDLAEGKNNMGGLSNATRGLFFGGESPKTTRIEYIQIASLGNGTKFGDMTVEANLPAGCASSTRGIMMGFERNSPFGTVNNVDMVEIATFGNAVDFGDLTSARSVGACCSNAHGGL
jgi:hypothetical protein